MLLNRFNQKRRRTATPIIDTAKIIIIWAWNVGVECPQAHPFEHPIICLDDPALVIFCAQEAIVAWFPKLWNPDADSNFVSEFRLNCLAEAGALVAHFKVIVIIPTRGARLTRYRAAHPVHGVTAAPHEEEDDASYVWVAGQRVQSKRRRDQVLEMTLNELEKKGKIRLEITSKSVSYICTCLSVAQRATAAFPDSQRTYWFETHSYPAFDRTVQ
jgi:hypothetical protein